MNSVLFKVVLFLIAFLSLITPTYATTTMYFKWHAAYFDAEYILNLGSDLEQYYPRIVIDRAKVVIRLDSLLRANHPEHFTRWHLVDSYTKSYIYENNKYRSKPINPVGTDVFFDFTDPVIIRKALAKLWNIIDTGFSVTEPAGQWMYSLHINASKNASLIYGSLKGDIYDRYFERPDTNCLWMQCESGVGGPPYFWSQYETDGYYHLYTGLYLTTKNVQEAQKLLKEKYNLETTITSQCVTLSILKKYMGR